MSSLTIKNNRGTSIYISPNGDIKINGTFNYYGTASEGVSEDVSEDVAAVPTNNISAGNIAGTGNITNDLPGVPVKKKKNDTSNIVITSLLKRQMNKG